MKLPLAWLLIFLSSGCGLMKRQAEFEMRDEDIQISRGSKISLATVHQISDARGGREAGEIWLVDRQKGDVRIRKSRSGSNPDDDVEVWHLDEEGSWNQRRVK